MADVAYALRTPFERSGLDLIHLGKPALIFFFADTPWQDRLVRPSQSSGINMGANQMNGLNRGALFALLGCFLAGALECDPVFAENWSGQTPPPGVNGPIGPLTGEGIVSSPVVVRCNPGLTVPPCTGGQTPLYALVGGGQNLGSLPAAAGPGSNLGVAIVGAYVDPSSGTGLSNINGYLPLDAFARASTVDGLTTATANLSTATTALNASLTSLTSTVSGISSSLNALSANVNAVSGAVSTLQSDVADLSTQAKNLEQKLESQDASLRQGVAISLAMDGTSDIAPDEHVSVSFNWGTFGGQNAVAAGVAFRPAQHFILNGGVGAGFRGGLIGGRAGLRMGW